MGRIWLSLSESDDLFASNVYLKPNRHVCTCVDFVGDIAMHSQRRYTNVVNFVCVYRRSDPALIDKYCVNAGVR